MFVLQKVMRKLILDVWLLLPLALHCEAGNSNNDDDDNDNEISNHFT